LRLDLAAELAFPDGSVGARGLRREAARGRLEIWRIAGKDMTTLAAIRRMFERCLVTPNPPASGSNPLPPTVRPSGSSSTEAASTALAAARMRAKRLRESSPSTSLPSTTPPPRGHVIPLKSR
jgi:hypothetical protein